MTPLGRIKTTALALALVLTGSASVLTSTPAAKAASIVTGITANPSVITQAGGLVTFRATGKYDGGNNLVGFYIPTYSQAVSISHPGCTLGTNTAGAKVYICTNIRGVFDVSWTVRFQPNLPCGTQLLGFVDVGGQVWKSVIVTVTCPTPKPTPTPTIKPSPTPTPTKIPSPTPKPTPSPTPTPALSCSPDVQIVKVNQNATVTTNGGGNTTWTAEGGTPRTGTGASFTTKFNQTGIFFAVAQNGARQAVCKIMVNTEPTPSPSPSPTPTPTPTPSPSPTPSVSPTPSPSPSPTVSPSPSPSPSISPTPTPTPTPNRNADIEVEKTDDRTITRPGHSLSYEIKVRNTGEVDLFDVEVEDTVPGQLIITGVSNGGSINGQTVRWNGVRLDQGQNKIFTITAKVGDNTPNNHILHNRVIAKSSDYDVSDEATDDTTVIREGAIEGISTTRIIEKPVYVAQGGSPIHVPITAPTGATGIMSLSSLLLGAAGLFVSKRLF